jgi:glucokinase
LSRSSLRGSRHDSIALALDIGGTNIRAGLIRGDGTLLSIERAPTPLSTTNEEVLGLVRRMATDQIRRLPARANLLGTGISIAAFVTQAGLVTATAHLSPSWAGADLGRLLVDLPAPLRFGLDSPSPAIGEAYFGAGKGQPDLVYVTVSTGIGAAVIVGGQHWGGGVGWAGGIGHTIIDETSDRCCRGCGNRGCLETFAARQGIEMTTIELMRRNPASKLAVMTGGDPRRVTARLVTDSAINGDPIAAEVLRRAGHALGIGLTNLVDVLAPSLVVVGGGIAAAGDLLLEPARAVVRSRAFPPVLRDVRIVPAALGDLSGLYGAAALVLRDVHVADPAPIAS